MTSSDIDNANAHIARFVKQELDKRKIGDAELADILDISKQSIGQWFKKELIPPKRHLQIASVLGISVDQLLACGGTRMQQDHNLLSSEERAFIAMFKAMSPSMKEAARSIMQSLVKTDRG